MSTLNKVILIGNLGNDVDTHTFDNGGKISKFPIATSETYTNKSGEKVTNTEWHNIVVKGKSADICEQYLSKGDKVLIEGKITTRKWQDKDGNDRYNTDIETYNVTFMSTKGDNASPQTHDAVPLASDDSNDDLPF
tara:strand:+ start:9119 stop:9526 length:408 start_codon:yes stop_codon:yes gene_type:complete